MLPALAATVSKVTTMADGSVRLQVDCQIMHHEHMAELFANSGKLGYFYFNPQFFSEVDTANVPEIKRPEESKTPAQRMRATLYVYWQQNKPTDNFETFYAQQIEKWISQIKEKLV